MKRISGPTIPCWCLPAMSIWIAPCRRRQNRSATGKRRPRRCRKRRSARAREPGTTTVVVDIPGTGQAAVSAVHRGIARDAKDYYAGVVTDAVLGGSYSARLNEEIRIKRGLSYGAGSSLDTLRQAGSFGGSAQTKNPSAAEVVGLLLGEFDQLATTPPADGFARRDPERQLAYAGDDSRPAGRSRRGQAVSTLVDGTT
jgi:predicted Zn-dependent peptidase